MALPPDERVLVVDELVDAVDAEGAPEGGTVKADPKLLAFIREREDAVRRGEATYSIAEVFGDASGK